MVDRNPSRRRKLLALTAVLAVGVGFGIWVYRIAVQDEYHVATFDCGDGRTIVITAANFWEVSQAVHYTVLVNGEVVSPKRYFTNANGNSGTLLRFDTVTAEDNNLVGVVQISESGERDLVILHDFATGESWPRLRDNEVSYAPSVKKKWRRSFDRIQQENPTLRRPSDFEE
jgi:hypothetical protein